MLISFGDFLYTNKALPPSGYVEEWWVKDLQNILTEKFGSDYRESGRSHQSFLWRNWQVFWLTHS